jgi:glycosylphosphatidylinositol transamidase (GPIT) subunit GPI8
MSIIDYYSRSVWIYVTGHKNDAFGTFKECKSLVETQTGRK